MKTIYLVRHGETNFNTDPVPRVRGRIEIDMNETGLRHADQAGQALKNDHIQIIYYSRVSRARQTAEAILKYQDKCKFIEEPLAIDISWGEWEGKTYLEAFGSEDGGDFFKNPQKLVVPNGESFYQCLDRIRSLFIKILQSPEETICIVSHGAVFNLLGCWIVDAPLSKFWNFYMSGCGVSKLAAHDIDDIRILYWNRQEFLQ